MSNPQIELVKKYLADPKSVSAEELKRAADAAAAAYHAAYHAADAGAADAGAAGAAEAAEAKYWVEEYEELTR